MTVGEGRTLLLVEDDEALRARLQAAMERRGFRVIACGSVADATRLAPPVPELALVDLRLPDGDGIDVARALRARSPRTNIVILTGYGSIATALDAVRSGASWFLTKPADADEILAAFARNDARLRTQLGADASAETAYRPASLDRMEWEHIQRVLADCGGNVTHAAEALGIHRRSLQRKLARKPSPR